MSPQHLSLRDSEKALLAKTATDLGLDPFAKSITNLKMIKNLHDITKYQFKVACSYFTFVGTHYVLPNVVCQNYITSVSVLYQNSGK